MLLTTIVTGGDIKTANELDFLRSYKSCSVANRSSNPHGKTLGHVAVCIIYYQSRPDHLRLRTSRLDGEASTHQPEKRKKDKCDRTHETKEK
jgi:hypothetical protein